MIRGPRLSYRKIPVADHPLRTIETAKTCVHSSKDKIYGEEDKGKTTYYCDIKDDPRCWTNCVRVSSTCVKCRAFKTYRQDLQLFLGGQAS